MKKFADWPLTLALVLLASPAHSKTIWDCALSNLPLTFVASDDGKILGRWEELSGSFVKFDIIKTSAVGLFATRLSDAGLTVIKISKTPDASHMLLMTPGTYEESHRGTCTQSETFQPQNLGELSPSEAKKFLDRLDQ